MIPEETARAFTIKAMTEKQIGWMREKESNLKLPTMKFESSQIAKDFLHNKRPKVTSEAIESMNSLWAKFYSEILYPQQQAEDLLHPEICCVGTKAEHPCSMFKCHHRWDDRCKTAYQEMWQWEDYVLQHYKEPPKPGSVDESMMTNLGNVKGVKNVRTKAV